MAALTPHIEGFPYETYAAADFADAEDTRPTMTTDTALISLSLCQPSGQITTAVENLIKKHTLEIQGKSDVFLSPSGANYSNQLRRKLREFFLREQQSIFQYLDKPIDDIPTISSYNKIIKRFGRPDFTTNTNSLSDLSVDLKCEAALPELNEVLEFDIATFTAQIGKFMNTLKDIMDEIMRCEDDMKTRVASIDKLTQNVQSVLTLSSSNPVYESMIKTTEQYIAEAIKQNAIEGSYKNLITAYKKLTIMKEAFHGCRIIGSASATEPLCAVCFTDPVNYCFSPCGHTYCQGCARKQNTQCFICRQGIRERVKLFFS